MAIIIKNGTIVTETETFKADIGISGDRIDTISADLGDLADEVIDAQGMYIFPGGIDPHTHIQTPIREGLRSSDDFTTGSMAAAMGGITTFIDFTIPDVGRSLMDSIKARRAEIDGRTYIDYSLHATISGGNPSQIKEIKYAIECGVASFKAFMAHRNRELVAEDGILYLLLEEVKKRGGIVGVHAENGSLVETLTERCVKEKRTGPSALSESHPNFAESEAVSRAIHLAEAAGSNLYIFHISARESADAVAFGRVRGVKVWAETCPQYLLLTREKFEGSNGPLFATSPPLRSDEDARILWEYLASGDIQVVGTNHCPFTTRQKEEGRGDFRKLPMGMPGVETMMPLLFSEGVVKGRITLNQFVSITSTNAAKIFGLYPKKGTIVVGGDADIVVFDPKREVIITPSRLHMNTDFSPYNRRKVVGWPIVTISRGRIVAREGVLLGVPDYGEFVPRRTPEWARKNEMNR